MHELFYCSFATRDMSDTDILNILEKSRIGNAENSITGILIYWAKTRQFMQILEGSEKAIFDLYEVIKKDDRHKSLKMIYSGEISERYFTNWTMGFSKFESIDKSRLEGVSSFLEKGFTDELINGHPSTAISLFQSFKELLPKEEKP
ncbi:MAG: hypothetical protein ACI8PD_001497 [Nitrospinales bacterium]|jgi:hypothetical protein